MILSSLKSGPDRYHFSVDLHECPPHLTDSNEKSESEDNPHAFWMWEIADADSGLRIGDKIILSLKAKEFLYASGRLSGRTRITAMLSGILMITETGPMLRVPVLIASFLKTIPATRLPWKHLRYGHWRVVSGLR